jgi:Raf kinase inhibitor-like YbhB/YbcL family protein
MLRISILPVPGSDRRKPATPNTWQNLPCYPQRSTNSSCQDGLAQLISAGQLYSGPFFGGIVNPNRCCAQFRIPHARAFTLLAALLIGLLAFPALFQRQTASAQSAPRALLQLSTSSFASGGVIPRRYTCDGDNLSLALQWRGTPAQARTLALVMHDPDAPVDFTHWLVYNLPANAHGLSEGASGGGSMPPGSSEGTNGFGRQGYGGPCPPPGKPHRYVIQIFALDSRLPLPAGAERVRLEAAMKQHVVAQGQIVGLYGR